jgi:DNA invertase Pin-like site-specific DNA recombinase
MCEMESDMAVYGYARVSTDGQSLSAQLAELKTAKCEKIFQEKISGARSDRKQLMRLMGVLAKGDVLVVTRLDSIGEVHTRSPQSSGNDRRKRSWVQISERFLG